MADILTQCIKCKCSLSPLDTTSKLLPCLHTMCSDCLSGRTDVAEKKRQMKLEKDSTEKNGHANVTEEESKKSEEPQKKETEKESEKSGEEGDDGRTETGETQEEIPTVTEEKKENENESSTTATAENQSEQQDEPVENQSDKQDEEVSSETATANDTSEVNKTDEKVETETAETCDPAEANDKANDGNGTKEVQENDTGEEKDSAVDEEVHTEKGKQSTEEEMEVVEETSPEPIPLTECPTCREPFNPDSLIDNVFIRKKASTSTEAGEGSEQKCTGCELNPSASYCMQCDDWLCSDCVNAHKRVKMTKDHELTSLEDAIAERGSSSATAEVSMLCRVHPKEKLTLFCEKCEVLTCRDCQLLQHQEHKYQFLQEAADSYKAKLTGSLSLMKDRRDVLKRYQMEIEERLAKVKREKSDLQQDILRQADIIVKAVRAAVWSVLSSLHSFTDAAAKRLSREVGDVGDLVDKFDHCISFMDGILEDGLGTPLLFSKTIVETKCRKVYHTHMEPQSLKGQLNIQYRHDVQSVIRALPAIGAIYVNGTKYPPEKNTTPGSSSTAQPSAAPNNPAYRSSSGSLGGNAIVGGQSQGHSHHLAPQERGLYMQMMMSRQPHSHSHANTTPGSQGPTLSLPGSRRLMGPGSGGPRGWPAQPQQQQLMGGGGLPGNQSGLMAGMMGQGQGQHGQPMIGGRSQQQAFTPMRLHHRPIEPNHMPSAAPPMVLGGAGHRPSMGLMPHLPAPPPLRSPSGQPQYRGAADGAHLNSGGQAAMSGNRRPSGFIDSPDPARPASGGHITPERPLSSEGAASSVRVKSEPQESTDCVITSATFNKPKKSQSPVMTSTSLGDLQKNLDEVIRGVPLDLGDNLEQINGSESLAVRTTVHHHPPHMTTSPISASSTVTTPSSRHSSSSQPLSTEADSTTIAASSSSAAIAASADGKAREGKDVPVDNGERSSSSHMDAEGHQVKGYATGNSMPGFTLAAVESADPNDDYCAACHQGGDVLCCDQCPRVFHLQCHVPVLSAVPSGAFVCTLCEEGLVMEGHDGPLELAGGKRKAPTGLSDRDLKVCERILLELFCHPSSIPFHEPVNRAVPNYYKIITNPMDFTTIRCKLSRNHFNHYPSIESFLDDCKLVFKNCAVYNSETSEVGKAGKIVRGFFERLVDRHMTEYGSYVRRLESPERDLERKKRKTTPPPHGDKADDLVHVH